MSRHHDGDDALAWMPSQVPLDTLAEMTPIDREAADVAGRRVVDEMHLCVGGEEAKEEER